MSVGIRRGVISSATCTASFMSLLLYHRVARHYLFFNYRNWNILERLLHKCDRSWVRRLVGVAGVACTDIAHTIPATLSVVVWPIFRILCFLLRTLHAILNYYIMHKHWYTQTLAHAFGIRPERKNDREGERERPERFMLPQRTIIMKSR